MKRRAHVTVKHGQCIDCVCSNMVLYTTISRFVHAVIWSCYCLIYHQLFNTHFVDQRYVTSSYWRQWQIFFFLRKTLHQTHHVADGVCFIQHCNEWTHKENISVAQIGSFWWPKQWLTTFFLPAQPWGVNATCVICMYICMYDRMNDWVFLRGSQTVLPATEEKKSPLYLFV